MSNHILHLLEAEAANRRLAQLFQSEKLDRATHQSTAIVTRDSSGAARRDSKQNSKMYRGNRRERTPVHSRTRTATPTIGSGDTKRDLSVSSFMLALVLVGVVVAGHTDHPVFWLFVGPTPFAVLLTKRTFFATACDRAGRAAHVLQTGSIISGNPSDKKIPTRSTHTSKRLHTGQIVNTQL
jgi:hypothetical protein